MLRVIIHKDGDCVNDFNLLEWGKKISHQYSNRKDMEVYVSRDDMVTAIRAEVVDGNILLEEVEIFFLERPGVKYTLDKNCKLISNEDPTLDEYKKDILDQRINNLTKVLRFTS